MIMLKRLCYISNAPAAPFTRLKWRIAEINGKLLVSSKLVFLETNINPAE
jgi:hypothetical protein